MLRTYPCWDSVNNVFFWHFFVTSINEGWRKVKLWSDRFSCRTIHWGTTSFVVELGLVTSELMYWNTKPHIFKNMLTTFSSSNHKKKRTTLSLSTKIRRSQLLIKKSVIRYKSLNALFIILRSPLCSPSFVGSLTSRTVHLHAWYLGMLAGVKDF